MLANVFRNWRTLNRTTAQNDRSAMPSQVSRQHAVGKFTSFTEFIRYLLHSRKTAGNSYKHWKNSTFCDYIHKHTQHSLKWVIVLSVSSRLRQEARRAPAVPDAPGAAHGARAPRRRLHVHPDRPQRRARRGRAQPADPERGQAVGGHAGGPGGDRATAAQGGKAGFITPPGCTCR